MTDTNTKTQLKRFNPDEMWAEICPDGLIMFYDGKNLNGFKQKMMEKFQLDVSKDITAKLWIKICGYDTTEQYPGQMLKLWGDKGSTAFYCPANLVNQINSEDKVRSINGDEIWGPDFEPADYFPTS